MSSIRYVATYGTKRQQKAEMSVSMVFDLVSSFTALVQSFVLDCLCHHPCSLFLRAVVHFLF